MPKATPLQVLRRKSAAQQRLTTGALPDSGYNKLKRANDELRHGRRRAAGDGEDGEEDVVTQPQVKKRRVKKVVHRKTNQSTTKPGTAPEEPVIQYWRPSGGETTFFSSKDDSDELSVVLGVARVPTWKADAFKKALRASIELHGEIEELFTSEFEHGGETHTDVFVRFRSELVAEAVKEKIDGCFIDGRKLQVTYA